jgi:hypothetical protein
MSIAVLCSARAQDRDSADPSREITEQLSDQAKEIGQSVDNSQVAREATTSILRPIYDAAEFVSDWPAFYWAAFALMVAGLVSFAGQLVFSKLLLLIRLHLSFKEIMADLLGLAISALGLILTTQAATQNSGFTHSPAAVLSATLVGALVGFVFFLWGQSQEFRAARGAKVPKSAV